jgi:ATP-binding protein involved in chromosome partitioning
MQIEDIKKHLSQIKIPNSEQDVISAGIVTDISFTDGEISLVLLFKEQSDRNTRHAIEDRIYDTLVVLEGVTDVSFDTKVLQKQAEPGLSVHGGSSQGGHVHDENCKHDHDHGHSHGAHGHAHSHAKDQQDQKLAQAKANTEKNTKGIKHIIAVASGKGGVGKSTVAANLALSLKNMGARVGLCDLDMYGPSIPIIMGVSKAKVKSDPELKKFIPVEAYGLKIMSIGFLIEEDVPVIWRGPIIASIVKQFLDDTLWGELDYLVIDLPPGTGDTQITLTQSIDLTGVVMVTTPSELAVADSIKGMQMFRKVNIPILGVVENMSYYICSHCGHENNPFNQGGTERMVVNFGTQILARIPLDDQTQRGGDKGEPICAQDHDSPQVKAFAEVAHQLTEKLPFKEKEEKKAGFLASLFKRG